MSRKFTFSNFYLIFGGILLVLLLALGLSLSLLDKMFSFENSLVEINQKNANKEGTSQENPQFLLLNSNSLLALSNPLSPEPKVVKKINVLATAYSSTPWETYGDPFITASGTYVKDGIVANNQWPFGTKIRFPELYGDKIFVIEDRMHWRKGSYHFDIWFPSHRQAKNFGAKRTYIEVLER